MRLHYMGKYDLNPESLPHGEHMPGAVKFREAESTKRLALIANGLCFVLIAVLAVPAILSCRGALREFCFALFPASVVSLLLALPHELLHAACFKGDVYLYTNLRQGMLFVVGPEKMSKARFILMSLLPTLVFGALPYAVGLALAAPFPLALGMICTGMGAGDLYNVFNAVTQMPKGARTYLHRFNSYWYMP